VPDYVHGVVNLRGSVLPVFDLSARLGWGITDPTARHVIIVVQLGNQLQGLIVDAVNDIVTLGEGALQPPPNVGDDEAADFLEGLASVDDRMVMVLSLARLTDGTDDLEQLAA
jgi:purine-binding chemotaxis protein CheW